MRFRFQPWQLAALLVLLCVGAVGFLEWRRGTQTYDASRLMQALPINGAVKVYIDVGQLRASGVLDEIAGEKAKEEPDYRSFADEINFDYRTDVDAVAAAFVNGGFYAAVRGHFDWSRLNRYVRSQQGRCVNGVCVMQGSQPNRMISFYPLSTQILALAVTEEPQGVAMISPGENKSITVPPSVIWVSAPGSAFKNLPANLPDGTRSFLSPLAEARESSFILEPGANGPDRFQIRLDVASASPGAATKLAKELTYVTDLFRSMLAREDLTPDKANLSGVLASGRFESHDSNVTGTWPLDRRVIEALVSGQVK